MYFSGIYEVDIDDLVLIHVYNKTTFCPYELEYLNRLIRNTNIWQTSCSRVALIAFFIGMTVVETAGQGLSFMLINWCPEINSSTINSINKYQFSDSM